MRKIILMGIFIVSSLSIAKVLTPTQEVELLESVQSLKKEVAELRGELQALKSREATREPNQQPSHAKNSGGMLDKISHGLSEAANSLRHTFDKHHSQIDDADKEIH